ELGEPLLVLESGLMVTRDAVQRFESTGVFPWVTQLRNLKRIQFTDREREEVLGKLLESPAVPPLDLDEALKFEERRGRPQLGLRITHQKNNWGEESLKARLLLNYGSGWMEDSSGAGIWNAGERVYIVRDSDVENAARET